MLPPADYIFRVAGDSANYHPTELSSRTRSGGICGCFSVLIRSPNFRVPADAPVRRNLVPRAERFCNRARLSVVPNRAKKDWASAHDFPPKVNFRIAGDSPGTRRTRRTIPFSFSILIGARSSDGSRNAGIRQGQSSNVIILSKCLCCRSNGFRRLGAERSRIVQSQAASRPYRRLRQRRTA